MIQPLDFDPADVQSLRQRFADSLRVERTRLLYQGSLLPTLFMLLNGLLCTWLLWSPERTLMLTIWIVWLMALVTLRILQVAAFDATLPRRQARAHWRHSFILGCFISGMTLGGASIALVPVDNFVQQAWVFGLLGAAMLAAGIAYAVSLRAYLAFVLPALVPPVVYLFWDGGELQRGWGVLGVILLVAVSLVAWQTHQLVERGILRRLQNQALIEELREAQRRSEQLNLELAREIELRASVEKALRSLNDHPSNEMDSPRDQRAT